MRTSTPNAYACPINDCQSSHDPAGINRRRVTVPIGAIQDAGFNTKNPIYVQKISRNHFGLTQDGSADNLVGTINGWQNVGPNKAYQVHITKLTSKAVDFVTMLVDKRSRYIDIYALESC